MFPTVLYLVLQIPAVQTQLVRRITNHFSSELKSTISIGRIEYRFFNKLSLNDILIKDHNNDTLLYSSRIIAGIRKLDFKNKDFGLGNVTMADPVVEFITDTTGQMNLNWYLDKLKSQSDSSKKQPFSFSIEKIDIENARFSLINNSIKKDEKKDIKKLKTDFSNLNLNGINGTLEELKIFNDTTSFKVNDLSFREKNGFFLKNLSSYVKLSGSNILFESTSINTDSSTLSFRKISLAADSSFSNFIEKVKLDINMEKSILNSSDLAYFIKIPEGFSESLTLSGRFAGTISELRGRNVGIDYREFTSLVCDFDLSGLPDIENAFIYIGVNSLITNARDVASLRIPGKEKFILPEVAYRLGNVSFTGSFTGFITDFVTYGEFRTSQGSVSTDISLRPEKSDRYRMKGLLSGININLGELAESELLGKVSIHANVDGYASSFKKFAGDLTGMIDSIELNKYTYRNVGLKGYFTDKTWDGTINVEDQNIKLDLLGMFNFSDTLPEFDFTLNLAKADLYKLNIDKVDTASSVSMLLTSNFKGNSIDNLDGEIKLLNSIIKKKDKTIELYDFSVTTFTENNKPALNLRTDFINADIRGYYNFAGLKNIVSSTLTSMFPSLFPAKEPIGQQRENDFTFRINFRNTDKINEFFKTGISLAENSSINGSVLPDSIIKIEGTASSLSIKNILFSDFRFEANTYGSEFHTDINSAMLMLPGKTMLKDFKIGLNTNPDKFIFTVDWDNKGDILDKGNITARGFITESIRGSGKPVLKVDIDSTRIYTGNNLWKINQSSVLVDSNSVSIDRIHISSADKFYNISGSVSGNPSDTLYLQFKGIDISPLNYLGKKDESTDTSRIKMDLKGRINGDIAITNVYKNLLLESDVLITDFSILGSRYGNISVNSAFDYSRKVVDISASNNLEGKRMFDVSGYYDPAPKQINLDAVATHLPVEALNPLLKGFASNIRGFATGKVNLSGPTDNLVLRGSVLAENVNMKINYLQTNYKVNDSILFDRNGFRFNNVKFTDEEGKPGTISGFVNHKNFHNYTANLTITMSNDFLVLNTRPKDNPMFYGKVYASGVTKIEAGPNLLSFDISAKTGKNTKFSIPLTDELSVTQHSFVSFINNSDETGKDIKVSREVPNKLGIDVNIDLTVNSNAEAELIFDPKVGDIITGRGSGMLNINLNKKGDFRITGDYLIESGSYLFTLGNILNKRFFVENGGKIMFNGELDNAEIELKAIYDKRLTTSLYPITQDQTKSDEKVTVEPQLLLSGRLFNPTVNFEINLPNASEETRTYLSNAIATEEELSRQFMYLLVMNRFYSEQSLSSSSTGSSGTSAMAVTTTEMLSNQLSNWISQISNDFDVGFNYKPGDRALNSDEIEVAFKTQVLNDKVTINGNLDYSSAFGNVTEQLTGDFDAEIRLTEKVRLKVFNRFNDTYSGKGPYTQGIGIFFSKDFERLSDFFRKKSNSNMKKEDDVTLKKEDEVTLKNK
jgi:hypothetical protein